MRAGNIMRNTLCLKERVEFNILSSPMRFYSEIFSIEFAFNKLLKVTKGRKDIRLLFEKIYLSKFIIIINKVYIVIMMPERHGCRSSNIRKD
jgi:hypothetical protein